MKPTRLGLLLTLFVLMYGVASAQRQKLELFVKDSTEGKPIPKATVIIIAKKDSALLEFGITDSLGKYVFKNINVEKSGAVVVSMSGYQDAQIPLSNSVFIKNSKEQVKLEVMLYPRFAELEDVIVSGSSGMIRMNKDTLEFNADKFGSQPNAVLEDLLRKLPGVEIRNGKEVYVNGQRVSRILVEGKEFFSSDPIVILKNLPADIIAKVQVADERNTVKKDLREKKDIPKTINLRLKKEFKKGAFGKFFGGYGSSERFETGGILNVFRDTLQVSLIGSANNQGRNSFSWEDLNDLGGFGRSEGLGGSDANNLSGNRNQGIETKMLAGLNANYNLGTKLQINAQYFYDQANRRSFSESLSQQFIGDSVLLSDGYYGGNLLDQNHKASAGLRWKQDSTGHLMLQANGSINRNRSDGNSAYKSFSKNIPLLSDSYTGRTGKTSSDNISFSGNYEKTLVKSKLDWTVNARYAKTGSRELSISENRYLRIVNNFRPDSVRQIIESLLPNRELGFGGGINKQLGDRHTLSWSSEFSDRTEQIGGDTYQFSRLKNEDVLVPGLSAKLMLHKSRIYNSASYRYGHKEFNIQVGVGMRNLLMQNRYNYDSLQPSNRSFTLFTPSLNVNFKNMGLTYSRNFQEPYSFALRPVVDSSNPLSTSIGNPDLLPGVINMFTVYYYKHFERQKLTISVNADARLQDDVLGNAREVFPDGKTIYSYINVDHSTNYWSYLNLNKTYNKNHWNYSIGMFASLSLGETPMVLNREILKTNSTWFSSGFNLFAGYDSKYTWRAGYNLNTSRTKNGDAKIPVANTSSHSIYNNLHVKMLKRLTWDGNITYTVNPGTPAGFKKQWTFCDMALTLAMLKKERLQLKVSAFDIFNQNIGQYRYTYMNFISDSRSLVQKRYFMATVFYQIKKF